MAKVWKPVNMKVRDRVIGELASCDFDVKDGLIEVLDPHDYRLRHNVRLLGDERLCRLVEVDQPDAATGAGVPSEIREAMRAALLYVINDSREIRLLNTWSEHKKIMHRTEAALAWLDGLAAQEADDATS